jgi:hypothetical protein
MTSLQNASIRGPVVEKMATSLRTGGGVDTGMVKPADEAIDLDLGNGGTEGVQEHQIRVTVGRGRGIERGGETGTETETATATAIAAGTEVGSEVVGGEIAIPGTIGKNAEVNGVPAKHPHA